ncbi:MAG: DEAD/DEAH box helicase [Calditrichaeota bacterium]|nr:DEAD/DEAH box helicase [Calditrichota bacterium]
MNPTNQNPDLLELKNRYIKSERIFRRGQSLVQNEMCTLTSRKGNDFNFIVEDRFNDFQVSIHKRGDALAFSCTCGSYLQSCPHIAAALISLHRLLVEEAGKVVSEGKAFTRKEMIKRVLLERQERAEKENYSISFGENIHGIHIIKTQSGRIYEITIRDFNSDNGYCSCPDFRTNKLGTCKHLIFAKKAIKQKYKLTKKSGIQSYPFIEIYCDPHYDYHISYYYEGDLPSDVDELLKKYFKNDQYILPHNYSEFLSFINEAQNHKSILIRPEVTEKIDKYFENEMLEKLSKEIAPDFSKIKHELFDYQKQGVRFSLFKKANIIADEMGLGKTLQAIATAVFKKEIYNLKRTLVICPASLKYQWKKEIERFSFEKAKIIEGTREDRHASYRNAGEFFLIANYEAVMRDVTIINKYSPDMIILDEAQRIKNYDTKTSHAVKSISKKHALVITGTPLENRLLDLYSIMNFIDPEILAPQWEFSLNHCYFDMSKRNRITGYFNLQQLKEKLSGVIIRREKSDVLKELPALQELTVPVELHDMQMDIHAGLARSLAPILAKKYKTLFDMQRIQQILAKMRMVCDSTFLVDKETNHSPKLDELQEILLEKLDIKTTKKKVIIFSEWKTMLHLISKMLRAHNIGHTILSGDVPVKKRGYLIEEFANNPDCLVFLSTDAGGTGLNLQFADTVINFELPWNPARKNQRIGRINRIGQESSSITAINLVSLNSIESRIADGIVLKESLFNAVLKEGNLKDEVDFAAKGRSTFIDQVQKLVQPLEVMAEDEKEPAVEIETEAEEDELELFTEDSVEEHVTQKVDKVAQPDAEKIDIEEDNELNVPAEKADNALPEEKTAAPQPVYMPQPEEIEATLNQGMQFLNGVFKMATGNDLIAKDQGLSINRETGEVVFKFKLPGFGR